MYLGDFAEDAVVDFMWSTNATDGSSITRSTNGTVSVYKGNGTTQSTAGVTDSEDFDSLTGIHHCRVDTSADAFYVAGAEYTVVLSGAVVDTKSVNAVIAHFSIERSGGALALLKNATYGLSAVKGLVDDLEGRLTAARAGYLENLSGGAVALQSSVDDLEGRLTATRAGYLDNLSGGAVATAAALATVAGYIDTEVAAILAAVDTEVAAIKAKTDALPSDPADDSDIDAQLATIASYLDTEVAAILAAVDTEVAAIKAKTDALPASPAAVGSAMTLADGAITSAKFASGAITAGVIAADAIGASELGADAVAEIQSGLATAASIAALNNLSAAQVNAEVVDALSVDTYAEPGSVPAATASLNDKVGWLFMLARNKRLTTASADKVRNDADSGDVATATLSDDGTTFTRGEYA